ncbi:MAG: PAS domain-containing sensor histidine kinase [Candidatus Margulisiibacteriota bacterium]|nr:MAG: PAS domain-containing sensor histidine kinase [Candidatus Margulisiibacteriota bacterium]HAR63894.1 PAS domain-containing sensor histidine kinase [Candidatus Margulisiibacteriota bacterium]HCT85869.1 PAS domain-containing sensor histidine kinase [Candidatus Margulisiibacteriota bacterium]HCY37654.1 PAS domain-containing sensor histidine kinase [Candidatus Margulisiibacteriota bacterium]
MKRNNLFKISDVDNLGMYGAFKIIAIYIVFSALWILFSDKLLFYIVRDSESLTQMQTVKGWLFVLITGIILYGLIHRYLIQIYNAKVALEESVSQFNNALANSRDLLYMYDLRTGRFSYISPACESIFGFTFEEIQEMNIKGIIERVHPDEKESVSHELESLAKGELNVPVRSVVEFRWKYKDSEYRWYSDSRTVTYDSSGRPIATTGSIRDITEQKTVEKKVIELNRRLEDRVKERTKQLELINKELESFSYSVSHDLQAPLRSVDGFSQVLLEDYIAQLDEEGQDVVRRIRMAVKRMGNLINDLLALSRVIREDLVRKQVDLSAIAEEILLRFQETDKQRSVSFSITPGIIVYGDERLLAIMLENLLGNAWKFTSGTANARIEFGVSKEDQSVFFIKDNGVGFDMKYSGKLFNVFQRLHTAAEFEGSGIGLAIVQRIINRHSGRIWAVGEVGKGATFFFTIE